MSNWTRNSSIQKLQTIIDNELGMNSYRLARYLNDISVDLNYWNEYQDSIWGYKFLNIQDVDLAQSPKVNVIKSVIDSLVSKISNQKVRPYFTPVNGLFSTRAIVKQAQQFFEYKEYYYMMSSVQGMEHQLYQYNDYTYNSTYKTV